MTEIRSFAGLTVDGDITTTSRSGVTPRPKEELEPLFRALLDDEAITSFGWTQYTPYFNDGDVCEFSVGAPWVLTKWDTVDPDDFDPEDYHLYGSHPSLSERPYTYEETGRREVPSAWGGTRTVVDHQRVERDNPNFDADRLNRAEALSSAIQSGEFEHAMLDLFGDHARVKVTRDGIEVEYYEHD